MICFIMSKPRNLNSLSTQELLLSTKFSRIEMQNKATMRETQGLVWQKASNMKKSSTKYLNYFKIK